MSTARLLIHVAWLPVLGCAGDYGTFDDKNDGTGVGSAALVIDRMVPSSGPAGGGTSTTLTGGGFTEDLDVQLGDVPCASLTVISSVELTCTTRLARRARWS